jgi:organic radical activating enzyme
MTGIPDNKPFCVVPFVEAFSGDGSAFRNCCATNPSIASLPGQNFQQWWQDPRLLQFRNQMLLDQWPTQCQSCQIQETTSGSSMRTAINQTVCVDKNFGRWPSRWNLKFGNVCNLSCWTCNENFSSVIAQHKKKIGILPANFIDPEQAFIDLWPDLEQNVLASYDYHDTVTLTLLGGEPMYNSSLLVFLSKLIDLGLAPRTRLEFHTNGTKFNSKLFMSNTWNHVCVFLSLDAVGKKAEWLRHGCEWNNIEQNVDLFKLACNYIEVHCTLSVLNINDLPALSEFCQGYNLPLKISVLSNPQFMSLTKWPKNSNLIANSEQLKQSGFEFYWNMIGSEPDQNCIERLRQQVSQFSPVRHNLKDYDNNLYRAIFDN